jgi:hypothetical protein
VRELLTGVVSFPGAAERRLEGWKHWLEAMRTTGEMSAVE